MRYDVECFKIAREGAVKKFELLYKTAAAKGINFNLNSIRNELNCTLLMDAARYGQLNCVKFLVKHGADINAEDVNGNTPLIHALICAKAPPDVPIIISPEKKRVVDFLLAQEGINVNHKNKAELTAQKISKSFYGIDVLSESEPALTGKRKKTETAVLQSSSEKRYKPAPVNSGIPPLNYFLDDEQAQIPIEQDIPWVDAQGRALPKCNYAGFFKRQADQFPQAYCKYSRAKPD